MRDSFIGYYSPSDDEITAIWQSGIIVLDTNVLLNLYRYSKQARVALLELISSLKNQLWLPHQVGLEYHRKRLAQIYGERKNCDELISGFRKLLTNLDESRRHPFVGPDFRKRLDDTIVALEQEIKPSADELDSFKRKDPILEQLTELYNGRIGAEPDEVTKDAWFVEGEDRYRRGIPPGFEDRKKADDRRFGDLLIWKEILTYAAAKGLPVMFVTDDAKKDWWYEIHGETVGPNPVLVSEMVAATGKPFHMYRPERFVQYASEHGAKPIPTKVVEEVEQVRAADRRAAKVADEVNGAIADANLRHIREAIEAVNPMTYSDGLRGALKSVQPIDHAAHFGDALAKGDSSKPSVSDDPAAKGVS